MIEDPPLITLRRKFRRPRPKQVAALAGTPTGFVVDALGGRAALGFEVKPVVPEQASFCGVALTCHAGPADNLAVFVALPVAEPGDVIVAAADGYRGTAITGDLLLGMAKNRGVVAFVTDGAVRDIPGIRGVGLPCFASGVTPDSPVRNGPGTVGLPVTVAGATVHSGDVILGDQDGVVVIPLARLDEVLKRLEAVRAAEADLDAKVKGGLAIPSFVTELFKSGKVREID
jgi:4-hydroxy-4-methyl-2-oxoglutarate aldolase